MMKAGRFRAGQGRGNGALAKMVEGPFDIAGEE
jgi:hypothetical protein